MVLEISCDSVVLEINLWWCGFRNHVWKVIRNLTEAMVSSVELYLNHETLGQNFAIDVGELGHSALCSLSIRWLGRSIRLSSIIVHLEIGTGLPGLPEDQQIRSYLDAFCVWQRKKRTVSRVFLVTLLYVNDLFANYIGRSLSFLKQWCFKAERLGPCPSFDRGGPVRQVWLRNLKFSKFDFDCSPSGDGGSSGMAYLSGMCSSQVFSIS